MRRTYRPVSVNPAIRYVWVDAHDLEHIDYEDGSRVRINRREALAQLWQPKDRSRAHG